jgi:hypothetical protein
MPSSPGRRITPEGDEPLLTRQASSREDNFYKDGASRRSKRLLQALARIGIESLEEAEQVFWLAMQNFLANSVFGTVEHGPHALRALLRLREARLRSTRAAQSSAATSGPPSSCTGGAPIS